MPLFTLPLATSSTNRYSAATKSVYFTATLPSRKRKRSSQSPSDDALPQNSEDDNSDIEPHLPAASTNPLSLTPAEILQYQLAGLELDKQLPNVKDFPHRGLPSEKAPVPGRRENQEVRSKPRDTSDEENEHSGHRAAGDKEKNVAEIKNKKAGSGPRLRLQHLMVLTTIIHKCLREDDLPRANRAWAMLMRTQIAGRAIDLRSTGYWSIGTELLIRSQENPRAVYGPESEEENIDAEDRRPADGQREWGNKEGRAKAKDFLTSLILQHPYRRQFQANVSALNLWPVMLTWEIYGIQYEQVERLRRIAAGANIEGDDDEEESSGEGEGDSNQAKSDDSFAAEERVTTNRRHRRKERIWSKKDEVRRTTLVASEQLAARVDEVMANPPYLDNPTMLEIRAHIALYIGHLSVPEKPIDDQDLDDENAEGGPRRSRRLGNKSIDSERRFKFRQRLIDHEKGKRKREQEIDRVRQIIPRIVKGGGNTDSFKGLDMSQDDGQEFHDAVE